MDIKKIGVGAILSMLLFFMAMPVASAEVFVTELDVGFHIDEGYFGWVEYKYTTNSYGFVMIYIDDVLSDMVGIRSGSWENVRSWKTRDKYFSLNQSMGIHNITTIAVNVGNQMAMNYSGNVNIIEEG